MVERAAAKEESERQKIVDWLATQVAPAIPTTKGSKPIAVPDAVSA
jgi:hypothetical protein